MRNYSRRDFIKAGMAAGATALAFTSLASRANLVGLTPNGDAFNFAQNLIDLGPGDIDTIDATFPGTKANLWDNTEGNFTDSEWAGATFHEDWLFANVQSPGVTFAIRGPWKKGAL